MFHATSDIDDVSDTRFRYIGHYQSDQHEGNHNNGVNAEATASTHHQQQQSPTKAAASFIKRLNPFSKSKSHEISTLLCESSEKSKTHDSKDFANSVKVLKQFWSEQVKTSKSTDNLSSRKSATIKYLSQSSESIYDKSQTLDNRVVSKVDDFNKFKDATFVRNQKNRLVATPQNFYPAISSSVGGGKIHWTKRDELPISNKPANDMTTLKQQSVSRKESISSSAGSISSSTNSTQRKYSFKTSPSIRGSTYRKSTTTNGTKVAQIAQKFNQIIQHDSTLLDEVKKRGAIVVHGGGGRVFKIKEDKASKTEKKVAESPKKSSAAAVDDEVDTASLGGKNSTRRRSTMLKKRPSIRILVESPKKDANGGNVLTKKQLYEANVMNKETIVFKPKPKVPDKSERVLAKTQELRSKKCGKSIDDEQWADLSAPNEIAETKATTSNAADQVQQPKTKNNFQKIYDKISFRPTFLYGYGKRAAATAAESAAEKSIEEETQAAVDETSIAVNASNKEINDTSIDDDLELAPIDLKLNVYFKDENLSAADKENINSQGSLDDVISSEDTASKPNSSFLFRSHSTSVKSDTACDVFIRDMLYDDVELTPSTATDEDAYEIIAKVSDDSHQQCSNVESENIYQTLNEVKGISSATAATLPPVEGDDCDSIRSYESFENYDVIGQNILDNKNNIADRLEHQEDDYILPEKAPEPPPPRKNTIPLISQPILTSTTSTLIQNEMHVPMIAAPVAANYELKKSSSTTSSTYEKIKYDRPMPSKLQPPQQQQSEKSTSKVVDENIYDTIKSDSKRVESDNIANCGAMPVQSCDDNAYENAAKTETMSIISNCYETISLRQNNYSTINQILRNAISTTTLTSEHRINSIYGTMVGQSLTPPSDRSASDASDEWIDLTDDENEPDEVDNNRFIV